MARAVTLHSPVNGEGNPLSPTPPPGISIPASLSGDSLAFNMSVETMSDPASTLQRQFGVQHVCANNVRPRQYPSKTVWSSTCLWKPCQTPPVPFKDSFGVQHVCGNRVRPRQYPSKTVWRSTYLWKPCQTPPVPFKDSLVLNMANKTIWIHGSALQEQFAFQFV